MSKWNSAVLVSATLIFFVVLLTLSLFFDVPREYVEGLLGDSKITVGMMYILIVITTTIFAPFAGLPLAPTTSIIIGPFLTAVCGVFGWTIGAVVAFFISRHLARPFLGRFVDLSRVEKYEKYIPEKHIFLWLVFLRIIVPVDILSYAIGLTRRIRFGEYVISTFIGVIPFSFIWAYSGYALIERDYAMFSIFSGAGLLLFFMSLMYYYTRRSEKQTLEASQDL
ncbi:TVP38/TMEM64 family protein [Candidatus Kaiserbacteria bacterium]|nr:TVP38/TMEM64 family protein [Candidatus Kaiserbacteria bacterium]